MEAIVVAVTPEDVAYVRANFASLGELARGVPDRMAAWAGRSMPDATYALSDGSQWFARDWWRLHDDAGSLQRVETLFARRYRSHAEALGRPISHVEAWEAYIAGLYGACLRDVTPENMVAKERLVDRIEAWLAEPRPNDPSWHERLHADVDALDGLERQFAACDRIRFGRPTSRDRLITAVRSAYPID